MMLLAKVTMFSVNRIRNLSDMSLNDNLEKDILTQNVPFQQIPDSQRLERQQPPQYANPRALMTPALTINTITSEAEADAMEGQLSLPDDFF